MSNLRTDYSDDILNTEINTQRRFIVKDTETGNVIHQDVEIEEITEFSREGDEMGGDVINETNLHLIAEDGLNFQFAKDPNGTDHGYIDSNGVFRPFKTTHTETLNVNGVGITDMGVDHKYRYVDVDVTGVQYLGYFTGNTSINVSALGATSTNQFIVCCPSYSEASFVTGEHTGWGDRDLTFVSNYVPAELSLSGGVLTITAPYRYYGGHTHISAYDTAVIPYSVYYMGHLATDGATYIGEFSSNTNIDVSAFRPTNINQFVLCTPSYNFQTRSREIDGTLYTYDNTIYAGSLALNGNILTVTVPRSRMQMFQEWADPRQIQHWDISMNLACKLYYVGTVHS